MIAPKPDLVRRPRFEDRRKIRPPCLIRRNWPRTGKPQMTIGIGMVCKGGLVIAADTRSVCVDGSTAHMRKLRIKTSTNSAIVATFAASDVRSTETLLGDIFRDLDSTAFCSLEECEGVVRSQMVKWSASHPHGAPETEFILGVAVAGAHCLYHCQPPNAMTRKGYIAIGQGGAIVDPFRAILFVDRHGPKTTLLEIAYLMRRAQTEYGSGGGGLANAVVLRAKPLAAFEVRSVSMARAEGWSVNCDIAMRAVSGALISGSKESQDCVMKVVGDGIRHSQILRFMLTDSREEIEDDGSIRPLPPPDFSSLYDDD